MYLNPLPGFMRYRSVKMHKQEFYRDQVEADLSRMGRQLDRLRAKAGGADGRDQTRYTRYVERIERKRDEISHRLDDLATQGVKARLDIERGLKEAWDRISIATEAAKARFH
jgi:hypothetical protein